MQTKIESLIKFHLRYPSMKLYKNPAKIGISISPPDLGRNLSSCNKSLTSS